MRTKVTLVLLFLNVALFLFIFRFERVWRTDQMAVEVRRRVLGAEAANLSSIAVTNAAPASSYRLEKRPTGWFLTEPFVWPANPAAVDRLESDLQLLDDETSFSVEEAARNGQSLAVYGLDHPALTVTLMSAGTEPGGAAPGATTFRIGSATKVGQRIYLLSPDGQRIHVVGRAVLDTLAPPLAHLRSDSVLTIPVFEARSLNLLPASGPRVRIQRDGARWLFETPVPARANKDAVELAINGLDGLRVKSFPAAAATSGGAGTATLRIGIEGDNRSETLFLGTPGAAGPGGRDYTAQLEDLNQAAGRTVPFIVTVPPSLEHALLEASDRLRDRHVLDFDPALVTAVTLRAPGTAADLVLQRLEPTAGAGGWQMALPDGGARTPRTQAADAEAVNHLLQSLALLQAQKFQSDAPTDADRESWGLAQPERRIALSLGSATQTLEIGQANRRDPEAYAQVAGALSVYAIHPDILRETSVAPSDWRDRRVTTLPASARLTALSLSDAGSGKSLWGWGSAPGTPVPAARTAQITQAAAALRQLQAVRFSDEHFIAAGGRHGPWKYRLDFTFALPGGGGSDTTSAHTLFLGDRLAGTEQWAGSAEADAIFVLEQPLIDALWILTYGDRDPGRPASL